MSTIKLQTIAGNQPEIEIPSSQLADYLEGLQTGLKKATPEMLEFVNQSIVDKYSIKAIMAIGGEKMLSFNKFDASAILDEFDSNN